MISIMITLYPPFTGQISDNNITVEAEKGASVRAVMHILADQYPELQKSLPGAENDENFLREVLILKGETIVSMDSVLEDGDRLHLLPAIVSG